MEIEAALPLKESKQVEKAQAATGLPRGSRHMSARYNVDAPRRRYAKEVAAMRAHGEDNEGPLRGQ